MSKKAWIIFVAVCVALLGALVYFSGNSTSKVDVSNVDEKVIQKASEQSGNIADQVYGKKDSKVVLVEYGDFQCPGCASAHPVIKSVTEKYKDQIAFVFRNFPLTTIHPHARTAASVAEAAGLQGKYWEMHDLLYENQTDWQVIDASRRIDFFAMYAEKLGLDTTKFRTDLTSEAVSQKVAFDQALGSKSGVTGTPTFFLNGKKVDGNVKDGKRVDANVEGSTLIWSSPESFEKLVIIPALKEAGIALPEEEK